MRMTATPLQVIARTVNGVRQDAAIQEKAWIYHKWHRPMKMGMTRGTGLKTVAPEKSRESPEGLKNFAANFGGGHGTDKSGFTTVRLGILHTQDQDL